MKQIKHLLFGTWLLGTAAAAQTTKTSTPNQRPLHRLETPLVSEYDTETWKSGKEVAYVELLPLDGLEQSPQKKTSTNPKSGVIFTRYKTNNPKLFWAKP